MPFDLNSATATSPDLEATPSSSSFDLGTANALSSSNEPMESVYRESTQEVINAPSSLNGAEIGYLDDTQNKGEQAESFLGYVNVGYEHVADTIKGFSNFMLSTPATLEGSLRAQTSEAKAEVLSRDFQASDLLSFIPNPFSTRDEVIMSATMQRLFMSKESELKAAEKASATAESGYKLIERNRKWIKDFGFQAPEEFSNRLAFDIGGAIGSIGTSVGLSVLTRSPSMSAVFFGELQKADSYVEAREKGFSPQAADAVSSVMGLAEGGLEFIGMSYFMKASGLNSGLKRIASRVIEEGLQEGSQQAAEEIISQTSGLRDVDVEGGAGRVAYAMMLGSIAGGGISTVMEIGTSVAKEEGVPASMVEPMAKSIQDSAADIDNAVAEMFNQEASNLKDNKDTDAKVSAIMKDFFEGNPINQSNLSERDVAILDGFSFPEFKTEVGSRTIEKDEQAIQAAQNMLVDMQRDIDRAANELENADVSTMTQDEVNELSERLDIAEANMSQFESMISRQQAGVQAGIDAEINLEAANIKRQIDLIEPTDIEQSDVMVDLNNRGISADMTIPQIASVLKEERGIEVEPTPPPVERKTEDIKVEGGIDQEYADAIKRVTDNKLGKISGITIPSFLGGRPRRIQSTGRAPLADFGTGIEKAIAPISTRIKNISNTLFVRARRFEYDMRVNTIADNQQLEPFLKSLKKLSNEDFTALDFAMKNSQEGVIEYISKKYGIEAEVQQVRDMLDSIYDRASEVGMDINYRSTFFPRRISDIDGLMDYLRGTDAWNIIQEVIDARAEKLGRDLTESERSALVNNLFRGFTVEGISLSKKGIFKERSIEEVNEEIDQFYETTDQALIKYILSANEAIAASKLFGKGLAMDDASGIDDSIGSIISDIVERDGISARDARILKEILAARFNEKSMGYISSAIRNLTYIDVMGSPLNAVTQIGDLTTSMYNAGIFEGVAQLPKSLTDKGRLTLEDIGIDKIAHEFESGSFTSNAVDKVFKATGLQKIDRVGKLNLVNSTLSKFQKQARKGDAELLNRLDVMFGDNAAQVREDLANGTISDDVKFLMFNVLSDMQPISQMEMPEYYLRAGNLKIMYMLKTFTIKQLDIYRRDVAGELRRAYDTGDKKRAVKAMGNLTRLVAFWVTMGASADYIKDLIRSLFGEDTTKEPEDYVIDNMLKAFGFSKYQANMVAKKGPTEVFFDIFIPPTKFIDNVVKDYKRIEKDGGLSFDNSRAVRSIPVGGELYYFWFGSGSGGSNTRPKNNKDKKSYAF